MKRNDCSLYIEAWKDKEAKKKNSIQDVQECAIPFENKPDRSFNSV